MDETIENIFKKFHRVSKRLLKRHNNGTTIEINSEYDVQDLLHALLLLYIDEIKDEEYVPSHGSKSTRIDFIIKDINIAIETKFVRDDLNDKKISDELILDKERYTAHPNCKKLYFFIYDPKCKLNAPFGIERDISEKREDYEVKVCIWPKY